MSMTICKECKNQISDTAKLCPHCGAPYTQAIGLSDSNKSGKMFAGLICVFFGIGMLIWTYLQKAPDYMSYELAEKYADNMDNLTLYAFILIGIGIFALSFAANSKTK